MIVIINGRPGAGKDEFVKQCGLLMPHRVANISTVDFVKEVAKKCGWDGTKTPESRKFLSDLKALLTSWNEVPLQKTTEAVLSFSVEMAEQGYADKDYVIFIHCREPAEIDKLKARFPAATTLLIERPSLRDAQESNQSDSDVSNYHYDVVVVNSTTIEALAHSAEFYLRVIKSKN